MKRAAAPSDAQGASRKKARLDNVEELEAMVETLCAMPRPQDGTVAHFWPVNLATGKGYGGANQTRLFNTRRQPALFCTFKQAMTLGALVRKGEKAVARVVFYKYDEQKDHSVPVFTPVFHVGQLTPTPAIVARVREFELSMRVRMMPIWMTKLKSLYDQRALLPVDHAIAFQETAVRPLVLLAAAAVMRDYDKIAPDKRTDCITPDLHAFLWPAVTSGFEAADGAVQTLIERVTTVYDVAAAEVQGALPSRDAFAAPAPYYCEAIYRLCRALVHRALARAETTFFDAMGEVPPQAKVDADVSVAALASLATIATAISLPHTRPDARIYAESKKHITVDILASVQHVLVKI